MTQELRIYPRQKILHPTGVLLSRLRYRIQPDNHDIIFDQKALDFKLFALSYTKKESPCVY